MNKRILYPNLLNGLLGWPDDWATRFYNGKDPCDMLIGPCVCGATHNRYEWDNVLDFYNAYIYGTPDERQRDASTLSYF